MTHPPNGPWLLPDTAIELTPHQWSAQRHGVILRDDLRHPWISGNKLRKLDGIFPQWLANQITDVVTCGGAQSAHCVAVAALCRQHQITPHLLVRGPLPPNPTGNLAMSMLYGNIYPQPRDVYAHRQKMFDDFLNNTDLPITTAILPEGAHCVDGLHGYIRLVGDLKAHLPIECTLVIDAGTGASAVALALGIIHHKLPWRVESICLLKNQRAQMMQASQLLAQEYFDRYNIPPQSLPIDWFDRCVPRRFGKIYQEDIQDCVNIARHTGVILDPIYTLAAWRHCQRRPHSKQTCLIHTGGGLNLMGAIDRHTEWFKTHTIDAKQ